MKGVCLPSAWFGAAVTTCLTSLTLGAVNADIVWLGLGFLNGLTAFVIWKQLNK